MIVEPRQSDSTDATASTPWTEEIGNPEGVQDTEGILGPPIPRPSLPVHASRLEAQPFARVGLRTVATGGAKDLDDERSQQMVDRVSIIGRRRLLVSGHGKLLTSVGPGRSIHCPWGASIAGRRRALYRGRPAGALVSPPT